MLKLNDNHRSMPKNKNNKHSEIVIIKMEYGEWNYIQRIGKLHRNDEHWTLNSEQAHLKEKRAEILIVIHNFNNVLLPIPLLSSPIAPVFTMFVSIYFICEMWTRKNFNVAPFAIDHRLLPWCVCSYTVFFFCTFCFWLFWISALPFVLHSHYV